jgi:histidinol dehydrogenase
VTALKIIAPDSPSYSADIEALLRLLKAGGLTAASERSGLDVPKIVAEILEKVGAGGDAAVAELTSRLDRAELQASDLRVPAALLAEAHARADQDFLALVREVAANIRAYQEHILWRDPPPLERGGRKLGVRYTPIDRIGVYVPGGRALYPSTVLMTVVPAQVAGVREIAIATPPTDGEVSSLALALAFELGISEVYRMGGAVGIGALALGTETIRPVHKIVGPGNAFVAEAKRQLFGRVGIDSIAGPSEVLIVADETAVPEHVAADLLAQAEHDPGSAVLVTPSLELAERVTRAVEDLLARLARAEAARAALSQYSAAIVVQSLEAACELANEFASEHLQIITANDARCLQMIRHAGAIFMGSHTPVPVGDYFAGPSHVLPTGGTAKFFGPLSANDFLKASSTIQYDRVSLAEDGKKIMEFAEREGLTAHAAAVGARSGS